MRPMPYPFPLPYPYPPFPYTYPPLSCLPGPRPQPLTELDPGMTPKPQPGQVIGL